MNKEWKQIPALMGPSSTPMKTTILYRTVIYYAYTLVFPVVPPVAAIRFWWRD